MKRFPFAAAVLTTMAVIAAASSPVSSASDDETPSKVGPTSTITTIAGTGVAGDVGDGGPAVSAELRQPRDTAVAPDGSIAVVDTRNNRIRLIAVDGTITALAGTGVGGSAGDGGPATEAELRLPHDVAYDAVGNLYIADANNHLVRKVDLDGIITTVAGTGESGYNGDDIPAVTAQLRNPKSVVVLGDYLYIVDSLNERIRRVDLATGLISTIAGSGKRGYGGDGGPALEAMFDIPQRIAADDEGNLYVADMNNNRIRKIDLATMTVSTVIGTGEQAYAGDGGPAVDASIAVPRGLTIDGRWLYVADSGNHVIRRVNLVNGIVRTVAGTGVGGFSGDGGPAGEAQLTGPRGLSVDAAGRLIIADTFNNAIRLVDLAPPRDDEEPPPGEEEPPPGAEDPPPGGEEPPPGDEEPLPGD